MTPKRSLILLVLLLLSSCASNDHRGRISQLENVKVEIKDVKVEGGLDKAMESYQKFLKQTPESELTPEAMRRLADLKIDKQYGTVTDDKAVGSKDKGSAKPATPKTSSKAKSGTKAKAAEKDGKTGSKPGSKTKAKNQGKSKAIADFSESEKDFEKRATRQKPIKPSAGKATAALPPGEPGADLQNAGAAEAIVLYKKLLAKYPNYERNDQVLYQLSRAYDETGQVEKAMKVMNRLIKQYPKSRYVDEVQFRRGEYYFTRKKYLDAEDAYGAVLNLGVGSVYYARALFKKGWTFYKQELYEESINEFITLLDYDVSIGYDFDQTANEIERKRTDDTFRVISLAFSNLGGAKTVQDYFSKNGSRPYEDDVYSHLAEFYFSKRRYSDAAATYNAFVERNPFHKKSPIFSMRVIDIYKKGHFPHLVIDAKKQYASTYGVHAEYWNYFNQAEFPEVLDNVKTNIFDLAKYYHSLYQNKKRYKDKAKNFNEASHWYKEFLTSFPKDKQSPAINFQLAELLLENKNYNEAAKEYERTAYDYPLNDKSAKAAYAAVYAYREYLKQVPQIRQLPVKRDIIRASLRLVDTFPHHEKATVVLGAAVDDLFNMQEYEAAIKNALRLVGEYPKAETSIRRGAWLVMAHSSFQLENFADAETGYTEVLRLMPKSDKKRAKLLDNLAASIYKQGDQARAKEDYKTAVRDFLRIADVAPNSSIRPTAEYDAAAVLIQTRDLEKAVKVLLAFRKNYPGHKLQHDVTKKIAYAYKELEHYTLAGKEYERVAAESKDEELIREAMLAAADMYGKAKDTNNSLRVYHQFVVRFPKPLEFALETYYKIAMLYKSINDLNNYRRTLQHIITADANAGAERTDRTRYLAAEASLVIIEPRFDDFVAIKLVNPLKKSMKKKQTTMKQLLAAYGKLVDYKVADVTAASTFYIAEIYYNFSRSLLSSEVPKGFSALELEEFKTELEDQAYPFEDKAISIHEKNVELLKLGIYSPWIDRSIEKLAKLVPARFAKYEEHLPYIDSIHRYRYSSPRFVREDAPTVYVEHIDFFRYASHISQKKPQDSSQNAEILNQDGLKTDGAGVTVTSGKEASKQIISEKPGEKPDENSLQGAQSPAAAQTQPMPGSDKVMATQSPQTSAPDATAGTPEDAKGQAERPAAPGAANDTGAGAENKSAKQPASERSKETKEPTEGQVKQDAGTAQPGETPSKTGDTQDAKKIADSEGGKANGPDTATEKPAAKAPQGTGVKDIKSDPGTGQGTETQQTENGADSNAQQESPATNPAPEKQDTANETTVSGTK
jgi:tetratricopeptide (TPR) repeat protein